MAPGRGLLAANSTVLAMAGSRSSGHVCRPPARPADPAPLTAVREWGRADFHAVGVPLATRHESLKRLPPHLAAASLLRCLGGSPPFTAALSLTGPVRLHLRRPLEGRAKEKVGPAEESRGRQWSASGRHLPPQKTPSPAPLLAVVGMVGILG